MADSAALSMVRLRLDAARLARESRISGWPAREQGHADLGLLVHAALAGLFGEGTVQPFRVLDDTARQVPLVGYAQRSDAALRDHAATFADPARYASCDWEDFAVKPIPELKEGRRLGFELRACPVARLAADLEVPGKTGEPLHYGAGSEVDVWVHRRWMAREADPAISREAAYTAWLRERLGQAAVLDSARLLSFRRIRLVRREHSAERRPRLLERPEALLRGELVVKDANAFRALLARGVGRHRAFGFGMLLLRSPGPC